MRRADDLDPSKLKQVKGRKKTHTEEDLLSLLPKDGLTTAQWKERAYSEKGIGKTTFFDLKRPLENMGKVTLDRISGKWRPR